MKILRINCLILLSVVLKLQSVIRCIWHPRLNEIVVSCGDGSMKIYFDEKTSQRFVLTIVCLL